MWQKARMINGVHVNTWENPYANCEIQVISLDGKHIVLTVDNVWVNNDYLRDTDVRKEFMVQISRNPPRKLLMVKPSKSEKLLALIAEVPYKD